VKQFKLNKYFTILLFLLYFELNSLNEALVSRKDFKKRCRP